MAEVTFSNAAVADLEAIDEYSVARFGEEIAETYMRGFDEAFILLGEFPLSAPLRPELGEGLRCLVHRQHRIFHKASKDRVLVIRVVHHAMDSSLVLQEGAG